MHTILIIKYGALGDFLQALQVFETLRYAFPHQEITLLTRPLYKELASATGYFDAIIEDDRLSPFSFKNWSHFYKLYHQLKKFDFIFDFQNAQRTKLYFHILHMQNILFQKEKRLFWSGQIKTARYPHLNPHLKTLHTLTRQEEQLKAASLIPQTRRVPHWVSYLPQNNNLPRHQEPYILLVPGAASHRPKKCWPIEKFKELIPSLKKKNLTCIVVGDKKQKTLGDKLTKDDPDIINLMGQTTLLELTQLIAHAALVIGNDTGPLHISAALDRPTLTLFSHDSDPRRTAPITISPDKSRLLSAPDIAQISSKTVISLLEEWGYPLLQKMHQI